MNDLDIILCCQKESPGVLLCCALEGNRPRRVSALSPVAPDSVPILADGCIIADSVRLNRQFQVSIPERNDIDAIGIGGLIDAEQDGGPAASVSLRYLENQTVGGFSLKRSLPRSREILPAQGSGHQNRERNNGWHLHDHFDILAPI
jgi:hypothetical protein